MYLQDGTSPTELQSLWRKAANTYTRIVADEAAQFVYQSNRWDWSIANGDFGILMPPFDRMWIEWKTPRFRFVSNEWHQMKPNRIAAKVVYSAGSFLVEAITSHSRTSCIGMLPIAQEVTSYDDLSGINTKVMAMPEIRYLEDQKVSTGDYDRYAQGLSLELWPVFLTIGWLNCRNVTTAITRTPSALIRKRRRNGKPTGLDYRRIELDRSTKYALSQNSAHDQDRDSKRLHIVRGHMRTYTAERPAFGSYVGNMWIHQHMRGDADLGRINHEYHVTSRGAQ